MYGWNVHNALAIWNERCWKFISDYVLMKVFTFFNPPSRLEVFHLLKRNRLEIRVVLANLLKGESINALWLCVVFKTSYGIISVFPAAALRVFLLCTILTNIFLPSWVIHFLTRSILLGRNFFGGMELKKELNSWFIRSEFGIDGWWKSVRC